jgi:large subunit ribosomal protein L6
MSRIGKHPISIQGVTVALAADNTVTVKGSKGELSQKIHANIIVEIDNEQITVKPKSDSKFDQSLYGLSRTLIANMVQGVKEGFKKELKIIGVGYKAQVQGSNLVLNLGYSHPINFAIPSGIQITQTGDKKEFLLIEGIDKQKVGQVAANIREFRKPEPYKGKGIRYTDEYVAMKAGKTASK